jgi:hypothetical protein
MALTIIAQINGPKGRQGRVTPEEIQALLDGKTMGTVGDLLDFKRRGRHRFLHGKDYPWVCPKCQAIVDQVAQLYEEGDMEDTDDNEAPMMYAGDHGLLCGGRHCAKHDERRNNEERDPNKIGRFDVDNDYN